MHHRLKNAGCLKKNYNLIKSTVKSTSAKANRLHILTKLVLRICHLLTNSRPSCKKKKKELQASIEYLKNSFAQRYN